MCGTANCTGLCLFVGHMGVQLKRDMRPHKQGDLIHVAVPHTSMVLLLSSIEHKLTKDENVNLFVTFFDS